MNRDKNQVQISRENLYNFLFSAALVSQRTDLTPAQRTSLAAAFSHSPISGRTGLRAFLEDFLSTNNSDETVRRDLGRWPTSGQTEKARTQAQTWMKRKVFMISAEDLGFRNSTKQDEPSLFFAWGEKSVLDSPRAAILNSRKPRRIGPEDRWVEVTKKLAEQLFNDGFCAVTGLGNFQYELVCALAKKARSSVLIVCDHHLPFLLPQEKLDEFLRTFECLLPLKQALILSPFMPGRLPSKKERIVERDRLIVNLAHNIMVAEIRPHGNMERLVNTALHQKAHIQVFAPEKFNRATGGNKTLLESGASASKILSETSATVRKEKTSGSKPRSDFKDHLLERPYLIHFTRSCSGPWPGQSLYEFYSSLTDNEPGAGHAAFDTLNRILREKKIRASGRLIRGRDAVVSFTARPLDELSELVRWRPGLIRWNFEPYGVAVSRDYLSEIGLARVIYGNEDVWKNLVPDHRYRFQLHEPPKTDWSKEMEWRLSGDLDLRAISPEFVRVIVPSTFEAEQIAPEHGYQVVLASDFLKI
ncbi:MAG: DNA-processing protein DprA [Candidatus Adiutricales bacterium]